MSRLIAVDGRSNGVRTVRMYAIELSITEVLPCVIDDPMGSLRKAR